MKRTAPFYMVRMAQVGSTGTCPAGVETPLPLKKGFLGRDIIETPAVQNALFSLPP